MNDYSWASNPPVRCLTFRRVDEPPSGKPILFSGAMVRAILEGRKTQTRRVAKPVRGFEHNSIPKWGMPHAADPGAIWWHNSETDRVGCLQECPYGKPGDRLYVRETWQAYRSRTAAEQLKTKEVLGRFLGQQIAPEQMADAALSIPVGSGATKYLYAADFGEWAFDVDSDLNPWRPSIHMPKWASRITLELTDVRVQRVQEITPSDCLAEGIQLGTTTSDFTDKLTPEFARLWDSINAKRGPKGRKAAA